MSKILFKKNNIKVLLIFIFMFIYKTGLCQQSSEDHLFSTADTAFVPKEIEDPQCTGINKEPYHATLMPYGSLKGSPGSQSACIVFKPKFERIMEIQLG